MKKADLHVHSRFSKDPSEWFLQKIGTQESYTTVEHIYRTAKKNGMDFVTLTDHNTIEGALYLHSLHPEDTFIGVETTSFFPRSKCKIHVLIWGLNEKQFSGIKKVQNDIVQLRDFIKEEKLCHSVAHATFPINESLHIEQVEQLFLLFDHFEGINGARDKKSNDTLIEVLNNLTPAVIDRLYGKYRIPPFSSTPWKKVITAGSDDHSGIFIGKTYTLVTDSSPSPDSFLKAVLAGNTRAYGRSNSHAIFALSIYTIGLDYCKENKIRLPYASIIHTVYNYLIDNSRITWKNRLVYAFMEHGTVFHRKTIYTRLASLITRSAGSPHCPIDETMNTLYTLLAPSIDGLVLQYCRRVFRSPRNNSIKKSLHAVFTIFCLIGSYIPLLVIIKTFYSSKRINTAMEKRYLGENHRFIKRILCFTDSLSDQQGIGEYACALKGFHPEQRITVSIATVDHTRLQTFDESIRILRLPCIKEVSLEAFGKGSLRIPSILRSLELITMDAPDEIVLYSPGPVGLLGLLAAHMMHIPCTVLNQTEYETYMRRYIDDDVFASFLRHYLKLFSIGSTTPLSPLMEYTEVSYAG